MLGMGVCVQVLDEIVASVKEMEVGNCLVVPTGAGDSNVFRSYACVRMQIVRRVHSIKLLYTCVPYGYRIYIHVYIAHTITRCEHTQSMRRLIFRSH